MLVEEDRVRGEIHVVDLTKENHGRQADNHTKHFQDVDGNQFTLTTVRETRPPVNVRRKKNVSPEKTVDATSTAGSFTSVSARFDVIVADHNVFDGHGELDALVAQHAIDDSNLFFSKWVGCGSGRECRASFAQPIPLQNMSHLCPPHSLIGPWLSLFGAYFFNDD